MKRILFLICALLMLTGLSSWAGMFDCQSLPEPGAEPASGENSAMLPGPVTFEHVEPIFSAHCTMCHSGPQAPQGLSLDRYDSALDHTERAWVVPGSPGASELARRVRGLSRPAMPLNQPPLTDEQIELIETWILEGARSALNEPAEPPAGTEVRLNGTLTSTWSLDELPLLVDEGTRIDDSPGVGTYVEVRGVLQPDGTVRATRIRPR